MAPEMLNERPKHNSKVDIWAIGCIIYELCTLEYCFNADGFGLFNQIVNSEHGKINLEYYSSDLQNLIDLLLIKDYKKRPDIKDLYNRLKILKNEIKMIIEIKDDDINKDIYFLENDFEYLGEDQIIKKVHCNGLKELNEENVDLYIDDKKYKYKKYHKFSKGNHTIILKLKMKIKDCSYMFCDCLNLTNIDLSSFNTSNVTNMTAMFCNCWNLKNIDLSSFNTSNVTNMTAMFDNCRNLKNIDLSSFNTSNVTDMASMFCDCLNLTNIDLSSLNTSNVANMTAMFHNCRNLINIDLSSFNTSKVISMRMMFAFCSRLSDINLSSFNLSDITYIKHMFKGCSFPVNIHSNNARLINELNISS